MRLDQASRCAFIKPIAMEKDEKQDKTDVPFDSVSVTVRFITLMQRYSGQRDLKMDLPSDPSMAIDTIITRFEIPWKGKLEKRTRIFINKQFAESYIKSGQKLKKDDLIAFIPISGGG
jgi:molybdopterin converting factor small subunit